MLTQTLRTLERDGLVSRSVTPSVPVRVDYALTPLGVSLLPVMRAIKDWAETHIERVAVARDTYDNRSTSAAARTPS
ncbi:DNA-binding HxlR family transcriptional regulator [Nonomuraea thailandensis]|uniref:DNA-binding HxlR family transcriptional regulator n=2 Tax=Nonomuraea thailandensis TaxID=1188745 RepID=A0A9X2JXL2_9ACTN|nr:DNA-binding HxlR family transcriptional regulator [Nonomuraea thailandensis]